MSPLRLRFLLLTSALALLAPAVATAAEDVVPPGNSGANQYTETYPTGGGNKNAYAEGDELSPGKVIGDRNVKKLKEHGEEGEAVAELAAETAPVAETEVIVVEEDDDAGGGGTGSGKANGGGGGAPSEPSGGAQQVSPGSEQIVLSSEETGVQGSSGLGEVLSQVFGSSGGGLGALLPLLMLATILWAFAFAARQQRRNTAD